MASPLKHMDASRIPLKVRSRRIAGALMRRLPVNPRRRGGPLAMLFDAFNPMNLVCLRPMIDALQGRPDVCVRFTNSRAHSLDDARTVFVDGGYKAEHVVLTGARTRWQPWDLYVCADHPSARRTWLWWGAPRVYTGHGDTGDRDLHGDWWPLRTDLVSTYSAIFITGELFMTPAREHCRQLGCPDVPQLIGFPKLDRLVDGSLRRERIFETLRLDPSRPTVMFASTWGPRSVAAAAFDDIATLITADDRYNVLLMLHQHCWDEEADVWRARIRPHLARPHVRLIQSSDCVPYLFVADALITDHSSIAYEFAVLDRPLFQFEYPDLIYSPPEQLTLSRQGAYRFRNMEELRVGFERGMRCPAERSAARKILADACFYRPGSATQRAVDALLALAREEVLPPAQ